MNKQNELFAEQVERLKRQAAEIRNAVKPNSVTAEQVGRLFWELIELCENMHAHFQVPPPDENPVIPPPPEPPTPPDRL